MGVTIKELKDQGLTKLVELIKQRTLEAKRKYILDKDLSICFTWSNTPEGSDFWVYIDNKHFDKAFKLHPEYKPPGTIVWKSIIRPVGPSSYITGIDPAIAKTAEKTALQYPMTPDEAFSVTKYTIEQLKVDGYIGLYYHAMGLLAIKGQAGTILLKSKCRLDKAFGWAETVEGHTFWSYINEGSYHNAFLICPWHSNQIEVDWDSINRELIEAELSF